MKIKEYFDTPQPISNEVDENGFYTFTRTINFGINNYIANILVAHIDTDTYAFGWELGNETHKKEMSVRYPSQCITTKGSIGKLIYGMTKVLERKISKRHGLILKQRVLEAIFIAKRYYDRK